MQWRDYVTSRMNGYNFTDRVRKVLQMAREEAARLNHEYVGTEHLLLGLVKDEEGVAIAVLVNLGADLAEIREKVEAIVKQGDAATARRLDLPYTSHAKKVLELSMSELRELGHSYIGTEHLLLGLLREEEGIAAQVLVDCGIHLEQARAETIRLLGTEEFRHSSHPRPSSWAGRAAAYNFTDRVRKVLQMAREEAARLRHEYVGTEHLLLAVIKEGEGAAAAVLTNLNVDCEDIRKTVENVVKRGKARGAADPDLPYTSRAKKVLELAMGEARDLRHAHVGTEHLLLGLLGEEKGIAAQVLADAGITLEVVRAEVLRLLGSEMPSVPVDAVNPRPELAYALGPATSAVLRLARDTAWEFQHDAIEDEHLLNGLIREDGEAVSILRSLGAAPRRIAELLSMAKRAPGRSRRLDLPYSANAKRAIWLGVTEALSSGHDSVGSGHLLLGLLRIPGVARDLLVGLGVTESKVREQLSKNH